MATRRFAVVEIQEGQGRSRDSLCDLPCVLRGVGRDCDLVRAMTEVRSVADFAGKMTSVVVQDKDRQTDLGRAVFRVFDRDDKVLSLTWSAFLARNQERHFSYLECASTDPARQRGAWLISFLPASSLSPFPDLRGAWPACLQRQFAQPFKTRCYLSLMNLPAGPLLLDQELEQATATAANTTNPTSTNSSTSAAIDRQKGRGAPSSECTGPEGGTAKQVGSQGHAQCQVAKKRKRCEATSGSRRGELGNPRQGDDKVTKTRACACAGERGTCEHTCPTPPHAYVVPWHFDGFDQVILCVGGRAKTFHLAPPVSREKVSGWLEMAQVPVPGAVHEVVLYPGDVLLLPALVCHRVVTAGYSWTVNWGFLDSITRCLAKWAVIASFNPAPRSVVWLAMPNRVIPIQAVALYLYFCLAYSLYRYFCSSLIFFLRSPALSEALSCI
eukprot:g8235.t1